MPYPFKMIFGLMAALLLGGCASAPTDSGFDGVQQAVMDRTGHRIQWDRQNDPDPRVVEAVHRVLQKELAVNDAVQVALLNNQSLAATFEELGIAQAEVVEAGVLKNPTFSAEVRFPKYRALPFDFDVAQSFLELLALPLRKHVAAVAFDAAQQRVTHEVLNRVADVKAAFYRAQGAEQAQEMRRSIVSATAASLEVAQRLHDAGNTTDLALANERALHEQTKIDLAKAERDALDAREELNAVMGVWGRDTAWTLAPRLPDLPAVEIDAAHLESLAVARRADLNAAGRDVETLASSLGLTKSTALSSDASLGGHLSRETDGATSAGPNIHVSLPLFNQGQAAIAAAQARLRQSQRRYAALAVQTRGEVRRARNSMLAARDLADYYARVILPLRHQIVQQNQLQFNAMQIGVFEWLQARQGEIDAGREYVEALKGYWVARTELERAVGGQLPIATQPATSPATAPASPEEHHHHQKP